MLNQLTEQYKKTGNKQKPIRCIQNLPHRNLIRRELKCCADKIAATDLSIQTTRDLIPEDFQMP